MSLNLENIYSRKASYIHSTPGPGPHMETELHQVTQAITDTTPLMHAPY
jgi:hypothetical protein